jgi:hypothetical protein
MYGLKNILITAALLAAAPAMAYSPPMNVAAVRDGTTLTVTWEHEGDAKSFSVWQATESGNTIFSGSVAPDTGRTSTFDVPSAAEVPQLCDVYIVARYLPEQPNMASEKVCATEAEPIEVGPAQEKTFTWTPPTHREDETPLEPGELASHILYWYGEKIDGTPVEGQVEVPMPETSTKVALEPGAYEAQAQAKDSEGTVSVLSEPPTAFTVDAPPPPTDEEPPTITLLGDSTVTVKIRETYEDAGAMCGDAVDGSLEVEVDASAVDTGSLGEYAVTFRCVDAAGNVASEMRVVIVDKRAPPKAPSALTVD